MDRHFLIALDRAGVAFEGHEVLSDLTWRLSPGEHWAILGENGAGKSVFFRLIRGEIWPVQDFSRSAPPRLYAFSGAPIESPIGAREKIGLASPELRETYRRLELDIPVSEAVATGFTDSLRLNVPFTDAKRSAVLRALARVGLERLFSQSVLTLSQGQLARILLARALVNEPVALILDEAADGLDARSRAKFQAVLAELAETGPAILFASHRGGELPGFIQNALYLRGGRIKAAGAVQEVLEAFTAGLETPSHTAAAVADTPDEAAGPPRIDHPAGAAGYLVKLANVDVVVDETPVLRDITWTIRPDENWAVIGENGAGKSTLLRLLAGDLHAHTDGGDVSRFPGLRPKGLWEIRALTGFVSWDLQADLRLAQTAEDIVASGFFGAIGLYQEPTDVQRRTARAVMRRLGAAHLADKAAASLSHGQLRKILICRAMVHNPPLLLLDEPLSGLDARSRRDTLRLFDRLAQAGTRLIIATHHDDDLPDCVSRILRLEAGRVAGIEERNRGELF